MSLTEGRARRAPETVTDGGGGNGGAFTVHVDDLPGETVLVLRGELDLWTQPVFVAALAGVDDGVARIVLDLSDLTFIDASSLGLIHRSRVLAGLRGTDLVLWAPQPNVLRVVELTGLCADATTGGGVRSNVVPLPSRLDDRARAREMHPSSTIHRNTQS